MMVRVSLLVLLASTALAGPAWAQDPRLTGRLSAEAVDSVTALVESASAAGLPTEPLILKALEGASKGAPDQIIIRAVESLRRRLQAARVALGRDSSEPELVAGADALYVGADPAVLSELREARTRTPVTVPLIVLTDLVQQGVEPDTVSRIVLQLTEAGVRDSNLAELRRLVEQDIRAGAAPDAAVSIRAEGILLAEPPGRERDNDVP